MEAKNVRIRGRRVGQGEVIEGTPADDADLREGYLITHIDGERITAGRDLTALVREHMPGDTVELAVERDSEEHTKEGYRIQIA